MRRGLEIAGRAGSLAVALAFGACSDGPTRHVGETAAAAVGERTVIVRPSVPETPDPSATAAPGDPISGPGNLPRLDERDLLDAMGEPAFVWTEPGARMWRYDADACALFVFLYPDGVRHAELHGDGLDDAGRAACFRELVDRAGPPSS